MVRMKKPARGGRRWTMAVRDLSDEDYAAWRSKQIRRAYLVAKIGFALSIAALALAIHVNFW